MWKHFEDLEIWQIANQLRLQIWEITANFPKEEKFVLVLQLKRAAHSVCANIAEAHGIFHYAEAIHHLYRARGSAEEVRDCSILVHELKYITSQRFKELNAKYLDLIKGINGYIKYIKKQRKDA